MKKQITNFTAYENQMLDFNLETPTLITRDLDNYLEEFDNLKKQFALLSESYPNLLDNDIININYQQLLEYVRQNSAALANCYNFYNKEKSSISSFTEYGIRIIPNKNFSSISHITITGYEFFKNNNIPNRKCQLNLKTREKTVKNYNMTIDDIGKCILDSDALNHLEKKIYSKGLNF